MPSLSRLAPVIKLLESCNLACTYCYQSELLARKQLMSDATLERILLELKRVAPGPMQILWFGGEPTLVGLGAFRRSVELAEAILGPSLRHALQTNATLIDDAWAALLARHRFAVTVSLDGPAELHDACRQHKSGRGSHGEVMRALDALQRHGIRPRASCVVTEGNLEHAEMLVDYFASLSLVEFDFPPGLRYKGAAFEVSVGAEAYGRFMVRVLERWLALGRKDVRIRSLAGLVRGMAGKEPQFCKLEGDCSRYVTFAHNGDIYPCDEFSGQEGHLLGNIHQTPLDAILTSPRAVQLQRELTQIPAACDPCEWRDLCRGGCPFERKVAGGTDQRSVVCEGLKLLYARMAREMQPARRPAAARAPHETSPSSGASPLHPPAPLAVR